jgi:gluconokinase
VTVLVVMGVSGCGKSTVGRLLAERLGWDFGEGDELHPPENIAKMASGEPLTDEDRQPWLRRVAAWIDEHVDTHRPGVITCSALKRRYRDVLRSGHTDDGSIVFVHLEGTKEQIAARLGARHGHYMPPTLLDSQLTDLEPPGKDEDAIRIDTTPSADVQAQQVIDRLGLRPIG